LQTPAQGNARLFPLAGSVLLSVLVASRARAAEAVPTLNIECPAFDDGARAELEARARAELAASGPRIGEVLVQCDVPGVRVTWSRAVGVPRAMVAHEGAPGATIDEILAAIQALLASHDLPDPSSPPPTASPAREASTDDAPSSRPAARYGVVAGMEAELWRGAIDAAVGAHAGARLSWTDR
jgi:hypothetical protein